MLSTLVNQPSHDPDPSSGTHSSPQPNNDTTRSPFKSHSPTKQGSPTPSNTAPHATPTPDPSRTHQLSSPTLSTPSHSQSGPTSLGNLIHVHNEEPLRNRVATSNNVNEEEEVDVSMGDAVGDGDITMEEDAGEEIADEGDDAEDADETMEGDDSDDDDEEDEDEEEEEDDDDDEDDDEDSGDESDESGTSDVILVDGPTGGEQGAVTDVVRVKTEVQEGETTAKDNPPDETGIEEEVNVLKPKKKVKRKAREESEEEDLPPPPPPMPTIRLDVKLPEDQEEILDWNFAEKAASAGFAIVNAWGEDPLAAPDAPVVVTPSLGGKGEPELSELPSLAGSLPPGVSADEAREMEEMARRLEEKYETKGKKGTRKRKVVELYDVHDPFIDDSDLVIDAPTHVARPKKEGFFVHQGALELMEESPAKDKKVKAARNTARQREVKEPRKSLSEAVRNRLRPGTRDSPIRVDSDDDTGPHVVIPHRSPSPIDAPEDRYPVDRTLYKNASREPKYLPPFDQFPEEVGHYLRSLRRESCRYVWDPSNKGKFPEHLKGPLQLAGEAAFRYELLCVVEKDKTDSGYDRYQEKAFVTALCAVLPYNRLTLGKLVLKLCYVNYWKWLQACEVEGLRQWKELLAPEIAAMVESHDRAVTKFEEQQLESAEIEPDDVESARKPEAPKKSPIFTLDMRDIFRQLVENTQEMVDVNRKMEEWGQRIEGQSSELNMRKLLYNKIGKLYPEGFMTSLTLSRAFTNYKRSGQGAAKQDREADKEHKD